MAEDLRQAHVVMVNGSPRHGTTLKYLRQVEGILLDSGVSTELISLAGTDIRDCSGCEVCIRRTGWCVQKDGAPEILRRMLRADGLVIATPVYMGTVTGKLKSLLDKTASWLHRPPAVGLPVLPLVTTAGSGAKRTLSYLTETVASWAAHPVGGIARSASAREPVARREVQCFLDHLRRDRSSYRPTCRQVMLFQVQRVLAAKVAEIDRRYWRERGWDRSSFYYPCRMGPGKRVLGTLFYRILYRRIRPSATF
jgi:multimeric flavodoxin WrbA